MSFYIISRARRINPVDGGGTAGSSLIRYTIEPPDLFSVSLLSGDVYLNEGKTLDYERETTKTFQVSNLRERMAAWI